MPLSSIDRALVPREQRSEKCAVRYDDIESLTSDQLMARIHRFARQGVAARHADPGTRRDERHDRRDGRFEIDGGVATAGQSRGRCQRDRMTMDSGLRLIDRIPKVPRKRLAVH